MSKMMNNAFSARENLSGKNRRLGFVLTASLILYIGAVIAFIIAY
jgi:hypothetical protein